MSTAIVVVGIVVRSVNVGGENSRHHVVARASSQSSNGPIASSASVIALAFAGRADGCFSRQLMITASSAFGTFDDDSCDGGVGVLVTCWMQTSTAVLPSNTRLPVSRKYATQPSA